jgi:hypothetical protein
MAKKRKRYDYLMKNHHIINIVLHQYARPAAAAFQVSVCFISAMYLCCLFSDPISRSTAEGIINNDLQIII